jgi:ABC-type transport system involved in multi-copper enzyme maturation permease subunit
MQAGRAPRRDWGESVILLAGLALLYGTPNRYTIAGPILTYAIGTLYVATCILSLGTTFLGSRRGARTAMIAAAAVLATIVAVSMAKIVYLVVYHAASIQGTRLIETALLVWTSNVIVFAIIYHLIGDGDFAFPQPRDAAGSPLKFLDYTFLAFTTATAFSPTDTPPLTTRARMCMMAEASISLMTLAIAAARAVNILS